MNEVRIFESTDFGQIRTLNIDGEPWFVAKDVSDALGYSCASAMRKLIDDEDKRTLSREEVGSILEQTSPIPQIGVINESGLYAAILNSTLSGAKKFKRWVTSEVLPSIRKTGSYKALPQSTDAKIALLAQGHQELREDIEAVRNEATKAKTEVSALKQALEDLKMDLPLFPSELQEVTKAVNARVISQMGGKESNAYKKKILRSAVFADIYSEIHRNFECSSYKSIPRRHLKILLTVVNDYIPPYSLRTDIEKANSKKNAYI